MSGTRIGCGYEDRESGICEFSESSWGGVWQGIESDGPWGDDGVQGWDVEGTWSTSAVGWEDGELHDPCGEYFDDGV